MKPCLLDCVISGYRQNGKNRQQQHTFPVVCTHHRVLVSEQQQQQAAGWGRTAQQWGSCWEALGDGRERLEWNGTRPPYIPAHARPRLRHVARPRSPPSVRGITKEYKHFMSKLKTDQTSWRSSVCPFVSLQFGMFRTICGFDSAGDSRSFLAEFHIRITWSSTGPQRQCFDCRWKHSQASQNPPAFFSWPSIFE